MDGDVEGTDKEIAIGYGSATHNFDQHSSHSNNRLHSGHSHLVGAVLLARNRCFSYTVGAWLQRDPIPALNFYEYVSSNPCVGADPLGLCDGCDVVNAALLPGANSANPMCSVRMALTGYQKGHKGTCDSHSCDQVRGCSLDAQIYFVVYGCQDREELHISWPGGSAAIPSSFSSGYLLVNGSSSCNNTFTDNEIEATVTMSPDLTQRGWYLGEGEKPQRQSITTKHSLMVACSFCYDPPSQSPGIIVPSEPLAPANGYSPGNRPEDPPSPPTGGGGEGGFGGPTSGERIWHVKLGNGRLPVSPGGREKEGRGQ